MVAWVFKRSQGKPKGKARTDFLRLPVNGAKQEIIAKACI
jgi:hypothetical protein